MRVYHKRDDRVGQHSPAHRQQPHGEGYAEHGHSEGLLDYLKSQEQVAPAFDLQQVEVYCMHGIPHSCKA